MENRLLSINQIRQLSETNYGELLNLYQNGYRLSETQIDQLSENDLRQTVKTLEQKIQTLQTSSVSWPMMIIVIILVVILAYYMLILRYKIESSAARKAGVPYSAVGVTGTRGGLFG